MTVFLTSSPCVFGADRAILNPANGFLERLGEAIPPEARCLFICSDPDSYERTDRIGGDMEQAFREAGFDFSDLVVLDHRNAWEAEAWIRWSDVIILAGGHVPTQNAFFQEIGLAELLRDYPGVIIGISAGRNHTVGLKADGTALAVGLDDEGQCQVALWNQLTAVSAGGAHTLGLRRDGRVVAAGDNEDRQCDVGTWQDITAVAAGYYHSVGLKADGTVVATGFNDYGQCDVSEWTDIVAVAAGGWHTLGLKADGSIVATGRNENGQCETQGWDNMQIP